MTHLMRAARAGGPICALTCLAIALAGVWLPAAPARADQGVLSYFLGLRAIGGFAEIDDVNTTGFNGPARIKNDSDIVGGIAPVFGARLNDLPIRFELEVAHRFRFDFDVRDTAPANIVDHEMNVSTTSALVSAILEWRNRTAFTPFAGAAVGWARNTTDVERVVQITGVETERSADKDNFAWGGTVGIDWDFAQNWTAQAAYRYTDLGGVDAGTGPGGETITADSHISHDLLLGVFYRF